MLLKNLHQLIFIITQIYTLSDAYESSDDTTNNLLKYNIINDTTNKIKIDNEIVYKFSYEVMNKYPLDFTKVTFGSSGKSKYEHGQPISVHFDTNYKYIAKSNLYNSTGNFIF